MLTTLGPITLRVPTGSLPSINSQWSFSYENEYEIRLVSNSVRYQCIRMTHLLLCSQVWANCVEHYGFEAPFRDPIRIPKNRN